MRVDEIAISLGAVAATVVRVAAVEDFLEGKTLTDDVVDEAARLATESVSPIDDVRGSAAYRSGMVEALVGRALRQLRDGRERLGWLERPVMLWGETEGRWPVADGKWSMVNGELSMVNGEEVALTGERTLLDALRAAGYVGVKSGCAEGECGSCTVFLDGMAVMACMVPAERARGSRVTTVEGLAAGLASDGEPLHPVQAALVQSGGVQCGYCTPGFVMSAAKLLAERPHPTRTEAQEALTGNLCRCTGYRKIIDAVVAAGRQ